MHEPSPGQARPVPARRRKALPWLIVAGALVAGATVMSILSSGGPSGPRSTLHVSTVSLEGEEVAGALGGGSVTKVSPPIDVDAAERWAGRLPLGAVPMPAERDVTSWRTATGAEVTQAVLYYPDPADAERLASRASALLSSGLGLSSSPLEIAGADAAMGWSGADFSGASFREGPFVVFVGVTGPAPDGASRLLAEAALRRVEEAATPVG